MTDLIRETLQEIVAYGDPKSAEQARKMIIFHTSAAESVRQQAIIDSRVKAMMDRGMDPYVGPLVRGTF